MSNITLKDHSYKQLREYMLKKTTDFIHLNNFSCISLASHYIFKMAAVTGCYGNFIYL